jgi:FAD/FMN-containing dehydrogenase
VVGCIFNPLTTMQQRLTLALSASAVFLGTAVAAISNDTSAVCSALHAQYPKLTVFDPLSGLHALETVLNTTEYVRANTDYFNLAEADNRPACVFLPSNAEDVAFAVKTLLKYPSVQFALKAGGHSPNLGYNSVDGGVLISFRPNLKYATPSSDRNTVIVGAGAKWEDVYAALDPYNKVVVGGRLGDVGVTGFLLGGGLSFLSAQHGLACDNIVNAEVVLANGTITNANATSNPDLFFALKGGGNQYAIVVRWTLKTYEAGDNGKIWGGVRYVITPTAPGCYALLIV